MKLVRNAVIGILVLGAVGAALYLPGFIRYKNSIKTLQPKAVSFANFENGTYSGTYDMDYVKVNLEFKVKDGLLTDLVILEHENGKGAPAEALVDEILETQNTDIDVVSGATASSKAILLAIENAKLID